MTHSRKKKTIEEVRRVFESRGYTLLSSEYKNKSSPLLFMCDKGHERSMTFNSIRNGRGCFECTGSKKYTILEIKRYFEMFGYSLESEVYVNNREKLDYTCDKGHKNKMAFNTFQQGHRCPDCMERSGKYHKSLFVKHPELANQDAIVYIFNFSYRCVEYTKVGVTVNWSSRKGQYPVEIKNFKYKSMRLEDAFDTEQRFIQIFKKYRIKNKLPFRGGTECFYKEKLNEPNTRRN